MIHWLITEISISPLGLFIAGLLAAASIDAIRMLSRRLRSRR